MEFKLILNPRDKCIQLEETATNKIPILTFYLIVLLCNSLIGGLKGITIDMDLKSRQIERIIQNK